MKTSDFARLREIASKDPMADRAFGCVIGALIGDAAGAVLEFQDEIIIEQV